MDSDQLEDLKQFIAASVSQSEGRLRNEMGQLERGLRQEMNEGFKVVRQEMADGFRGVGEAIDTIHKQLDEQSEINTTVHKRLTKLERHLAP